MFCLLKISLEDEKNNNDLTLSKNQLSESKSGERKSDIKRVNTFSRLLRKGHERNKISVLQESFTSNNKFILSGLDNSN